MKEPENRPVPPVFSSEQEQNKAECAAIWYTYAKEAEQAGDILGARMGFVSAWKEQPEEFRYFQTVVNFLDRIGQIEELIKVYEIGIQLHSHHVATFINFSNLLNTYGFYDRAREVSEVVLARDSQCLPAWGNLGNAFRGLGDYERALACFEKILKSEPGNALAKFNLSNLLLASGDFEAAWPHYESRLQLPGYHRLEKRNQAPRWKGEDLKEKTLLVYAEQGLGDTFMFGRYLRAIREPRVKVYFEVQHPVTWIMRSLEDERVKVLERHTLDQPCEIETDFQIPLHSLAALAGNPQSFSFGRETYLFPDTNRSHRAKELLSGLSGLKVGLCWQGNPHSAIDCGRSIPLGELAPLMELSGVDYISLQSRDGLEDVEAFSADFSNFHFLPDLDVETDAFAETVCLLGGLDLVITSDTSIAHLSGAMGKETWVLLQCFPEWRWGREGPESTWYANTRLFRQPRPGDWNCVIQSVKDQVF